MVRSLLIRGMLVGVLAGLAVYCFAKIFGEPSVDLAIAFEAKMDAAMNMPEMPELVSRAVQSTWGLLTGAVLYGCAFGGLLALVFAYAYGRMGSLGPRSTSAILALIGFVTIVLVPDLKYPANPPSVGHPDTIGMRTEWFFMMIVISIAAMTIALSARKALAANHGSWNAAIVAGFVFVAFIAVAQLLLPVINEVPADFPAAVLWQFRVANLGMHAVMWTVLGLGFGVLAERVLVAKTSARPFRAPGLRTR
ncbi:MAG TPA: CbtA family protein [Candidatus Polarisedimenticolia bacterium]|nr:CbtA family protein [Candidatus Polarisedimenticolia bacterium]